MLRTRRFCPEDLAFVERMLVAACFPPTHPLPSVEEARLHPHAARWLDPSTSSADIAMVAELDGVGPVGAAVGRQFGSSLLPELAIAVADGHRQRGVGEALLRSWIDELCARGVVSASLTVSVHNDAAARLYRRCGFREAHRDERRVLMYLADLLFQVAPSSNARLRAEAIDGDSVRESLVLRGRRSLRLVWLDHAAVLPVEDDATFLVDAWKESLELVAGTRQDHLVYLLDGGIDVAVERTAPDTVSLTCRYTPYLHRDFTRTERVSMAPSQYASAWNRLMQDLLEIA